MTPMRFFRRLLGVTTIAAAGMASDTDAAAADLDDPSAESADLEPVAQRSGDDVAALARRQAQVSVGSTQGLHLDSSRLETLVDRLGPADPALAAVLVGTALCMAHPLERIALMSEWAMASSVIRRRALARALSHPFTGAGVATAIDALAQDADAIVRTAAAQAALLRLGLDPDRYGAILERAEQRAAQKKA